MVKNEGRASFVPAMSIVPLAGSQDARQFAANAKTSLKGPKDRLDAAPPQDFSQILVGGSPFNSTA